MTEHELEQQLRAWYRSEADAAGSAPLHLQVSVSAIPDELPARRGLFGMRRNMMVLAAAALLVALVVGGAIAVGAGLLDWLIRDRDEIFQSEGIPWNEQPESDLPAGTYWLEIKRRPSLDPVSTPIRITFTVPNGWERIQHLLIWGQTKWFGVAIVDNVFVDWCHLELGVREPPIGSTPADLAEALAEFSRWQVTATEDVTFDGFAGKHVKLIAPADTSDCWQGEATLLPTRSWPLFFAAVRANEPVELWILDVQGTRLVINAGHEPYAGAFVIEELQMVIDSIRIDPLPPAE
jgi:hypothetical protein